MQNSEYTVLSRLYLGIDPGVSGAWAVINQDSKIVKAGLWEERDILIGDLKLDLIPVCTCIEKCHSMPRQGVASTFTFGENIGFWKGLAAAFSLSTIEIVPAKWQKTILDSIPTKESPGDTEDPKTCASRLARNRKALKQHIVSFVKTRFPDSVQYLKLSKHQGIADAICLAEYARKFTQ